MSKGSRGLIVLACLAIGVWAWTGAVAAASADAITVERVGALEEALSLDIDSEWIYFLDYLSADTVLAYDGGGGEVWDLATGSLLRRFPASEAGRLLALFPDGDRAVSLLGDRIVIWTFAAPDDRVDVCTLEDSNTSRAAVSPDGRWLALVRRGTEVELWDVESMTRIHVLQGHTSNLFRLAFSPDGRWLASASGLSGGGPDDSCIKVWDVATGELLATLATPELGDNHDIEFSADGRLLVTIGVFGFQVWSTETWTRVHETTSSNYGGYGVAIGVESDLAVFATDNRFVLLWDLATSEALGRIFLPHEITAVAFSEDGAELTFFVRDGTLRVWRLP